MENNTLTWTELKRKLLQNCRIFDLYEVEKSSPVGDVGSFYLLDTPDWINVIPLIADSSGNDCFLMVEQYRHGSGEITLEFPAGMVDRGELPATAAARELTEETGYSGGEIFEIGSISPNPAFMNNTCHTFVARNLKLQGAQNLDKDEYIHFHLIPVTEVLDKMGTGKYSNGVTLMAALFYNKWVKEND